MPEHIQLHDMSIFASYAAVFENSIYISYSVRRPEVRRGKLYAAAAEQSPRTPGAQTDSKR